MTAPPPSTHNVGRFTSLVLAAIVSLCLIMIGVAGFLKYQLDLAETSLAAPDAALTNGHDMSGQIRRNLGYSGYLGSAQTFITARDPSNLADMKTQLKAAKDITDRLPERISTETRRDLQSILSAFQTVTDKAERSLADNSISFTGADLIPLYAALPIMDARVENAAAGSRLVAQSQMQFWSMLLTLVAWASLIVASAMAVNVYLSLRDRNSAPLRALAQSVKNMARGDMRTPIWGMERQDMVGELARAVDLARYQFSQLPDIALLSDNGPLRMKFEGQTKSMFDAMMQNFGRDAEKLREQAGNLTEAITKQDEAIALISSRVEAVLHNVEKRGLDGDQQVRRAVQNIASSAESLIHAQQHTAEQLGRLLPYMQERAQGMAEIAQLTGKQVALALQNLTITERGLRGSAEQSDEAIKKLSTTADELGSRLFGAVNLLQASGKVLSETTEKTQSRLNEVLTRFGRQSGDDFSIMQVSPVDSGAPNTADHAQLSYILATLEQLQAKLEESVHQHANATEAQIDLLITQSSGLLTQTSTAAQSLAAAGDHLRAERTKLDDTLKNVIDNLKTTGSASGAAMDMPAILDLTAHVSEGFKQTSAAFGSLRADIDNLDQTIKTVAERSRPLAQISDQLVNGFGTTTTILGDLRNELSRLDQSVRDNAPVPGAAADSTALLLDLKSQFAGGFERTASSLDALRADLGQLSSMTAQAQTSPAFNQELQNRWFQLAAQIEATRNDLAQIITQQVDRLAQNLEHPPMPDISRLTTDALQVQAQDAQRQMEQQTLILSELVTTLGVLDAHMQQLKSEMHASRAG